MNKNLYTLFSFTHKSLKLLLPSILLLATITCSATNWHTVRIGPANSLSTWSDGTSSPTTFATPGDTWTINDSIFIPRRATWTIGTSSSAPVSLILGPRGELGSEYGGNVKLIVFGDVLIRGGRMEHYTNGDNDTMYIHGNFRIDSGIVDFTATYASQCIYIDSNLIVHGGTIRQAANTPMRFISVGLNFEMTGGFLECIGTGSELNLEVAGNCNFDSSYLNFNGTGPIITFKINGTSSMTQNKISLGGNGPMFYDTVYGNVSIHNNYFYANGTSPKSYYTFFGNTNIINDTIYTNGTSPFTRFDITGNCNFNYDSVSSDGTIPELQMVVRGNLNMISSHLAYRGTRAVISDTVYGNCSITGSSYFSNNRTLNTIHLALPSSTGTMQIENTSNGPWSRTTVYVDSGCTAQLSNNFSTSTGVSPSYGLIVNGKLICPAAYAASGTGIFTLNQYGMLTVANALGINGNITTSGVTSFHPAATYLFDGSVAQVTGSYLPMSLSALSKIILNNGSGVTLSRSTTTTGILQFIAGILHTDTAAITTRGITGAVIGADSNKYVDGLLCKTIVGATTLQFEVGDTSYAPMQLAMSSMGTSGKIGVRCIAGLHPNVSLSGIDIRNIVNHYWSIQNYAASGPTTVAPSVNYNYASIVGGSNRYFKGQRYSGGSWLSSYLSCTNTTSTYASIIDSPVALSSMQGDYIFGNTCSATITGFNVICAIGDTSRLTSSSSGGVWISSDTSIASVSSSGLVTGRAYGRAIIYYSSSFCASSIIVYVGLSPITGITNVCTSSFTTLFDSTIGGTWSSSSTSVATVGASSGLVTAVGPGTAIISYTVSASCGTVYDTIMVTVVTTPSAGTISGVAALCVGYMDTFATTVSGGTFSSSAISIATVGSTSGIVSALAAGSTVISYIVSNICGSDTTTATVSVNPLPTAGIISGPTSVCVPDTILLTNSVTGGNWSSSDVSVATVNASSGLLTAVGAGSAIISYTVSTSCGTAYDTIMVTVGAAPYAGTISGVAALCVGILDTFTTTVSGGTFSSSAISIATVDSALGVVNALAAGSTVITYTVSNSCGSDITTATVTVDTLPIAGAISGPTRVCVTDTILLTNSVTGGTWRSSNSSIGDVNTTGYVLGVAIGTVTISYTVTNSCGSATTTYTLIVNPTDSCLTSIKSTSSFTSDIKVYPNPSYGSFNVAIPSSLQDANIAVLDMCGALVNEVLVRNTSSNAANISLPSNAQGIYTVRIATQEGVYIAKLICLSQY